VGDTGPGGGIVFYVSASTFNCGPTRADTCKYLEVAPSLWAGGTGDPFKLWAVTANQTRDVDGITGGGGGVAITNDSSIYTNVLGIGLGYQNSVAIVNQGNDTTTAAGAARAYTGGSMNDWYLPTTIELIQLCRWNRGTNTFGTFCATGTLNTGSGASASGFVDGSFWSSSEVSGSRAWTQTFTSFSTAAQNSTLKTDNSESPITAEVRMRPIRAFAPAT
jgi:hypothetical protein